ncbi:MAG: TRAP transporter large permease [Betaproteobacteria bacterium]|nr:TRAP transporter large permease [Betaproteobacteria bacterium]
MTTLMLVILAVWFVALFLGPPIWLAMALAAWAFLVLSGISDLAVAQRLAKSVDSFPLLAAPLFILMGNIMNSAGITTRIFEFAKVSVGWMRGGLCHANIVASVFFAGTSGSAVADAGGLGTIEIKAMTDEGYSPDIAAAVTASSATIGPIIPPSLPMIIYGVSAEASIGALFLAGVIPGLLMAGALMVMVRAISVRMNLPRHPFPGIGDLWRAFKAAFWALMTPVILFAGLFGGAFTPTEAAAVSVAYALALGLFIYRDFQWRDLPKIILDTVETTGVVLALVMAAGLMAYCLTVSQVPQLAGGFLARLTDNPLVYLLIVNVILLVVGCFMEAIAAMLILIPILVPPAMKLGIDPIQFGLIFVLNLMIGTITPPVGVVLFVTAKVAGISFERVTRATLPFLVPLLVVLGAITLWPPLTTWLPRLALAP